MQRYPENTTATIEDFRNSGWQAALDSELDDYHRMWDSFSKAARVSLEEGKPSQAKVLWLLADVCSMMLKPDSANEPFKPFFVMKDRRSCIPEDFQEQDIDLLAQVSEEIADPRLQARLADLVWLLKRPRSPKHAVLAVDAYRKIPLDADTWMRDGRECWERAISLCRTLRSGAGERIKEIESSITNAFDMTAESDGFWALWLSDLLFNNGLGKDRRAAIADKLESLAKNFDNKGESHRSREFFAAAGKWFKRDGNEAKIAEMAVAVAELWVKEATAQSSHMVAASFYENAIQVYRTVPRARRPLHKVDERLAELHRHLSEAGERSLDEMGVVKSSPIDITEIVEDAQNSVKGKDAIEALLGLANIHPGFREGRLRERAEKTLMEHPILGLFSATHISRDGRTIAKLPGMGGGDDDYQATVWAEMVRNFGMELSFAVQGRILPALETVVLEHRLRLGEFISLARRSPIVPVNRDRLFGKALFAGYEGDFTEALHILAPQIEHMVRSHLKAAGIKTTSLDREGIENESGLSSLMEFPEVRRIFGEDIAFEIKVLFCDPLGPNLRNEVAHGLLDDDQCESFHSVYAWWLGLKLVFNTFWNSLRKVDTLERGEAPVLPTDQE